MTIFTGNYVPYEYANRCETLKYVTSRALGLKKSLRLVEKDSEHLTIRCPLSGDYLEIVGEKDDLEWLDNELRKQGWYRPNC